MAADDLGDVVAGSLVGGGDAGLAVVSGLATGGEQRHRGVVVLAGGGGEADPAVSSPDRAPGWPSRGGGEHYIVGLVVRARRRKLDQLSKAGSQNI
ncbi:hypothetical protein [Nocardia farcinica]|uniref:hypothetical protein n=1 Tax=Nocardia farcinica TaxID=37329 RepID=UPI0018936973|nr:hypothetical protein [Nocardia farcinica]MBF6254482.1 hypothetical protein [Nocardia farcinica]